MKEKIVDLTNTGYIENGAFFGIQFDPRHEKFEVVCGTVKKFAYLKAAKKWLTTLAPGWEMRVK